MDLNTTFVNSERNDEAWWTHEGHRYIDMGHV